MGFHRLILIFAAFFIFYSLSYASRDALDETMNNPSLSRIEKIKRLEQVLKKAYIAKDARLAQRCADYFLVLNEKDKALNGYRKSAKIALIKKNYTVVFYCGKRISYLGGFDEGEVYFYHAAKLAMRNADWFVIIGVARELVKIKRFKSADKWLLRAGYFVRRRKSLSGICMVVNTYRSMGYKYLAKAEFWEIVARRVKKELRRQPY